MRSVSVGRRPAITSSSSSSFGSVASARATSSRLRSGSVSADAQLRALVEQIEPAQHLVRVRARRADVAAAQQRADHDIVLDASAPETAARSGRCGRCRGGRSRRARRPSMRSPAKVIVPSSGANTPAIMLNSVVLPAPFGPITAKIAALRHLEADAVDRDQAAEALADAVDRQAARSLFRAPSGRAAARATARRRPAAPSPPAAGRRRRTPAWRRADRRRARQQRPCSASASPVSRNAPRIGPNSVPTPPMIGPRMISIERRDVEHLLGKQVVVDRTRRTRRRTTSCRPRSPPRYIL